MLINCMHLYRSNQYFPVYIGFVELHCFIVVYLQACIHVYYVKKFTQNKLKLKEKNYMFVF